MTKEQILGNYYREHTDTEKAIYEAMEHYKEQEVAKEREKAKNLIDLLDECIECWHMDKVITLNLAQRIKQSLTEYEKL